MSLKVWQQTTPYSCGAACLMCALSEINGLAMGAESELRLWENLHHPSYPGILPASIAVYAYQNKVSAKILYSESTVLERMDKLSPIYNPVRNLLFSENKAAIEKSEKSGVQVCPVSPKNLFQNLPDKFLISEDQKLITAIETSLARLHYILIRKDSGSSFAVMDPAVGKNFSLTQKGLLKEYGKHTVGISVLLGSILF